MREWLVAADDRTGALETAAEIARTAGPVTVTVEAPPDGNGVVDLGTRAGSVAAAEAAVHALPSAVWQAHKMDSTLRGNWAAELRARGGRALVIAAWPQMGRTCAGGVVRVHGSPVGEVRDHLPEAELLGGLDVLRAWLAGEGRVAALDITTSDEMDAAAAALVGSEVLIAGPAGPIGACFAARFGRQPAVERPSFDGRVLVVCGSATEVSREQLRRLREARPDLPVLDTPVVGGDLDPLVARELGFEARGRMGSFDTLLVIGGDTAAAVLGDGPRLVGGTVAPGMPWSLDADGGGPLVITKAGGFGDPDALARLLSRETG